jgi:spermidine synthase
VDSSGNWYVENLSPELATMLKVKQVVYSGNTNYQKVDIIESNIFGRSLILDGKTQSTEVDEHVYHESLVHPVMFLQNEPQRIFIGGGGEGATLRESLNHISTTEIDMVDLDQQVIELSKKFLPNHHKGSFDNNKLSLFHTDARAFLLNTEKKYDVAILDLVDPLEEGTAYQLYTKEFYQIVYDSLTTSGSMVTQSGPADLINCTECYTPLVNTIGEVFPFVVSYHVHIPAFGMPWGFTIGSKAEIDFHSNGDFEKNMSDKLNIPPRYYDRISHEHMFALPKYLRDAIREENRINTDINPIFMS